MELLDEIIKQYRMLANSAAMMLMEVEKKLHELEKIKMDNNEFKNIENREVVMIPFAAYEAQLERFDAEKEKMRKHYKHLIALIAVPFSIFLVGVFVSVMWFLNNYDFASYQQDGDGVNNYLNSSSQGDVTYEPTYPGNYLEKPFASEGNLDQQEEYWNDVG